MDLTERLRDAALPLPDIDDPAFAEAFDRYGESRVVLLGEASHGTSEFYRARAAITRRLVEHHGFTLVCLEADWPDAACLNRRVRGRAATPEDDQAFSRFPHWMWRNREFDRFVDNFAALNAGRPPDARAGIYGLDLYNLAGSMRAVIEFLERADPDAAAEARERYGCLAPWSRDPATYGRLATRGRYHLCRDDVIAMERDLLAKRFADGVDDPDALLDAQANARLVANAEAYYRVMYEGAAESWNLRDSHMFETLCQLLDAKGGRAVVWAHNSHLGDARHTDMGWSRGEHNLGQLVRERFGNEATLIGFGTHTGRVAAADDWDGPMRTKRVNPSMPGSVERLCHDTDLPRFLLPIRDLEPDLAAQLSRPRLERYIGVIYRPETERWSHYVESALGRQFDAWVWFDQTDAVTPTRAEAEEGAGEDELYPFGV